MRAAISRHRGAAQRGADPDPLRDVQAYVAVRFRDRGTLDLQAAGGMDTSWSQVCCVGHTQYNMIKMTKIMINTQPLVAFLIFAAAAHAHAHLTHTCLALPTDAHQQNAALACPGCS